MEPSSIASAASESAAEEEEAAAEAAAAMLFARALHELHVTGKGSAMSSSSAGSSMDRSRSHRAEEEEFVAAAAARSPSLAIHACSAANAAGGAGSDGHSITHAVAGGMARWLSWLLRSGLAEAARNPSSPRSQLDRDAGMVDVEEGMSRKRR